MKFKDLQELPFHGLKIRRLKGHAGSSPAPGTNEINALRLFIMTPKVASQSMSAVIMKLDIHPGVLGSHPRQLGVRWAS
jgi:hypothetical protein